MKNSMRNRTLLCSVLLLLLGIVAILSLAFPYYVTIADGVRKSAIGFDLLGKVDFSDTGSEKIADVLKTVANMQRGFAVMSLVFGILLTVGGIAGILVALTQVREISHHAWTVVKFASVFAYAVAAMIVTFALVTGVSTYCTVYAACLSAGLDFRIYTLSYLPMLLWLLTGVAYLIVRLRFDCALTAERPDHNAETIDFAAKSELSETDAIPAADLQSLTETRRIGWLRAYYDLKSAGALSEEEYQAKKNELLSLR